MDYNRAGRDLDRTIQILKMRGSAHVAEQRKLLIAQGGLRVEELRRAARQS